MKQVCVKSAACSCTRRTTAGAALPTVVTAMPEPKSIRWFPSTSSRMPPPARSMYAGSPTPTPEETAALLRACSSWDLGPGMGVTSLRCWSRGVVMRPSWVPSGPAVQSAQDRVRSSHLRAQHPVDEVDRRVRRLHPTTDHVGAVDRDVVAGAGHLHGATLDGLLRAVDVARRDLPGHHVVGKHLGEQVRVALEGVDGLGGHLGEGGVDRREDRELAAVEGVDEVDLRVELTGDGRDQRLQERVV